MRRSFGLVEELTILVLAWLIPNFSSIPTGSKLRSSTKKRGSALSNHTLISPETHQAQCTDFPAKVTWKQFPVVPLHRPNATLKVLKVTKSHQVPPGPLMQLLSKAHALAPNDQAEPLGHSTHVVVFGHPRCKTTFAGFNGWTFEQHVCCNNMNSLAANSTCCTHQGS